MICFWGWGFLLQNQGSMDAMNMDTVCRLYEVGRQRLAEDEEDEEEDQVRTIKMSWFWQYSCNQRTCLHRKMCVEKASM